MDTLSLTKEARIYNGKKTTSLTSGAWKTGQPLAKEWNWVEFNENMIMDDSVLSSHLLDAVF